MGTVANFLMDSFAELPGWSRAVILCAVVKTVQVVPGWPGINVTDDEFTESAVLCGDAIQHRKLLPILFKQADNSLCIRIGDLAIVTVVSVLERVVHRMPVDHVRVIGLQKHDWSVVTRRWGGWNLNDSLSSGSGLSSRICDQRSQRHGGEQNVHAYKRCCKDRIGKADGFAIQSQLWLHPNARRASPDGMVRRQMNRSSKLLIRFALLLASVAWLHADDSPANLERKMKLLDQSEVQKVLAEADRGNPNSQLWAGLIYDLGVHVASNQQTAMRYYRKAADQGSLAAAFYLGGMYFSGAGVQKDEAKALELYRAAADGGYPAAEGVLGFIYVEGRGVKKDLAEAFKWYTRAANHAFPEGEYNLGLMYKNGEAVAKDCKLAVHWLTEAANQLFIPAQTAIGDLYDRGVCAPQDYEKAAKVYGLAATQGDSTAQLNLGSYYLMGRGMPKDPDKAFYWYTKSAEAGNANGEFMLGEMYRDGQAVKQDLETAYKWFAIARARGSDMDGRESVRSKMSAEQIARAEAEAERWIKAHGAK